jgi:penicillin-binding protein 2
MTELRNVEADLARFRVRVLVAGLAVIFAFGLVAARMVYLQVMRHDSLLAQAESNRTAVLPVVPNRGQILDRYGRVLATNYSAYTLEITPSKVANLDATIDALGELVDIQPRDKRRFRKLLEESRTFDSLPIRTRLSDEEVARFTVQRYRFPGVDVRARLFRQYPHGEVASHVIGYIGRINQREKAAMEDWPEEDIANYRGTDYIGKLGAEQSYERQLHGLTGFDRVETSAGGRAVRSLANTPATPGNTVVLSIDIQLQKLVEDMFGQRRGALVAIDPRNGEVLAFVSKPTFDPNLFVEGIDVENWKALNESVDKPLLNRALRGTRSGAGGQELAIPVVPHRPLPLLGPWVREPVTASRWRRHCQSGYNLWLCCVSAHLGPAWAIPQGYRHPLFWRGEAPTARVAAV